MDRPDVGNSRRMSRSARLLGWTALIAGVVAVAALVPPLVAPKARHRSPTAAAPSITRSVPAVAPPSASVTPSFAAITVHAADPANMRVGARIIECASCAGGRRVGYIGGPNILAVHVTGVAVAGSRTLVITYETESLRTLKIAVNGTPVQNLSLAGAGSWVIPAVTSVPVFLPAGASWIKFFNDAGPAPDINTIVIS
jgi:hypothetical protein